MLMAYAACSLRIWVGPISGVIICVTAQMQRPNFPRPVFGHGGGALKRGERNVVGLSRNKGSTK